MERISTTLIRKPAVRSKLGDSNTAFYVKIGKGLITRPIKIGERAVAWPSHEIDAIVDARIAGKSEVELRDLVQRLHSQRSVAAE